MKSLEALGKAKLEQLISQLIYETEPAGAIPEDYEEKVENSFKEFAAKLESLYDEVDKDDNCLFDVMADFAQIHDDIYFETGFWTGLRLAKKLESASRKNEYDS